MKIQLALILSAVLISGGARARACDVKMSDLRRNSPFAGTAAAARFKKTEPVYESQDKNGPFRVENLRDSLTGYSISSQLGGCDHLTLTLVFSNLNVVVSDLDDQRLLQEADVLVKQTLQGLKNASSDQTTLLVAFEKNLKVAIATLPPAEQNSRTETIPFNCGDANACSVQRASDINSASRIIVEITNL